jgi:hypothetical protein
MLIYGKITEEEDKLVDDILERSAKNKLVMSSEKYV